MWALSEVSLLRDARGRADYFVAQYQHITERKRLEKKLAHRAFHDSLTGLPNRSLMMDRLGHALARKSRAGGEVAVLFMDLDDFKVVNDSLGQAAGDRLLVTVAERLRRCLRPQDTAARFGVTSSRSCSRTSPTGRRALRDESRRRSRTSPSLSAATRYSRARAYG